MAEITSSPTVSIQSLLYPNTTDTQTTTQTTQSNPTVTSTIVPTDTSILPSSGRGYSAATLGLTPPRPGGSAEADLLMIRQMLEDMNNDTRNNEIMASTQRKATALGGALSLLSGMVESVGTAFSLILEKPVAYATAARTRIDYDTKKQAADDIATQLAPVKTEFDKLTGDIAKANQDIGNIDYQIGLTDASIDITKKQIKDAKDDLGVIEQSIYQKNQQIDGLKQQLAAATTNSEKQRIQGLINTAQSELSGLLDRKTGKEGDITNLNTTLDQWNQTRSNYVTTRAEKVTLIDTAQTRLDEITPTKLQLESDLNAARQVENDAYNVWHAAQSYADGIQPRIDQAFADFAATMAGFTLMANRLAAVPGMPDAGLESELATLRKENKDALADLWNIMTQSREKLGTEAKINEAINAKLKDVDDVQRAKLGLAFSSIFTSLRQALGTMAVLLDPTATNGGSNFSEHQPQRMRFAIGGTA
ncbi:coiled-coil domain-containing protein [Rhizobium alvei]|uniref:Uncharacterized protein n=1 Tax=Rhizobium alvei TaxID=1132659 RepID=A0ABT8YRU8_9HYPH|nr:hypothetical protein [Rhizobium alvei]MDO6966447.1 hypothetical protein [Rhizobium alvei]